MTRRRHGRRPRLPIALGFLLLLTTACAPSLQASDGLGADQSLATGLPPAAEPVTPSPIADYLVGQYAVDTGDIVRAAEALGRAQAADPDDLELRRQVFFLDVASGDRRGALAQAAFLADLDPGADEPRLALFIQALTDGRLDVARADLDALSTRGIGDLIAPILRAWLAVAEGDPQRALEVLPPVDPADPLFPVLIYHRAAIQDLAGQPGEALASIAPVVEQQQPASARAMLLATRLIHEVDGAGAAIAFLDETLALQEQPVVLERVAADMEAGRAPDPVLATPGEGVADILLAIVEALRQQGAVGRAIVYARLATWAAPVDGESTLALAGLMVAQGNPTLAIQVLDGLPATSSWNWEGRLATVDALVAANRQDEAEQVLAQMVDERPERIDALVKLGDLARAGENYADAAGYYSQAIGRVGVPSRRHWRLFYARGVARERIGDWDSAVDDFQEAMRLEPDQPLVLNYLGYSWVDRGENLATALGMLQKAVELRPRDGFIIDSLGWAYFKTGQLDEAVTWLERAVEAEPGDPVINEHLGDVLWLTGRTREARFQWQRALSLSPDEELARLLRDKLENGLES
ncbi:tetratricopeptide repeat protein [Geminicoccus roseus]|uniref:tetratricopeptide repeat protein n=1 Tax=Geminicoccus roseus TaxID=404900 RepID=UPI0004265586|nr:tetratricopeptide repeat protein [Geminicoccus roseus]